MNTSKLKSSMGFAVVLLTSLTSGVGMASSGATHYLSTAQAPSTYNKQKGESSAKEELRAEFARAIRRSHHLKKLLQNECIRISQAPHGATVDADAYQGFVDSLRNQERMVQEIIAMVNQDSAEEFRLLDLRKAAAEARSAATNAVRMAKQTTSRPAIMEGDTNGEAMEALANRFGQEIVHRFS